MTNYLIYPEIDEQYGFPAPVNQAIADSPQVTAEIEEEVQARLAAALGTFATAMSELYATRPTNGARAVGTNEQDVYVEDFLALDRIPGVTDDRPAFEAARLTGKRVRAREGTFYLSKSPDWGDNAFFKGAGKGRTIIKFLDSAPAEATLWGNVSFAGTVQGYFADFTLDGNCQRQGGTLNNTGGSASSNLTLRNCKNFYIDRVSSINPLLHGFDVTRGAIEYPYGGDGFSATLRSSDCYFDQVDSTNFGDDGFTTHSSDRIHVSRSVFYLPRKRGNNNGIEFDGDSKDCTATNNLTLQCYAGIEVKGHANESSAQNITINGHMDIGSVRSYNFRHIGFHDGTDPISKTAKNITATNLISIGPNNDLGFQEEATPRAIAISAFHGVTINGFTAIGRGGYNLNDIAIAIQYRSRHITILGVNISGWGGAAQDISITSGDVVTISGHVENSSRRAVYVGSSVTSVNLLGLNATAPTDGTAEYGIYCYSDGSAEAIEGSTGVTLTGYVSAIRASDSYYTSWSTFKRRARDIPSGITRIVDLPTDKVYYASSSVFAALTDIPVGAIGGWFIEPSYANGDSLVRTITRNTHTTAGQTRYWHVENFVTKAAGPWNRQSLNDLVPISGVLPVGGTPPAGSATGSIWLVRNS